MKTRDLGAALIELSMSVVDPPHAKDRLWHNLSGRSWHSIADLASQHGLSPLLNAGISERHVALPPSVGLELQRRSRVSSLRNVHAIKQVEDLLVVLNAAGITPVILKGLLFAAKTYPSPGMRPFSDIDFLIARKELTKAAEVALDLGYTIRRAERGHDVEWWLKNHNHLAFQPVSGLCVEFHWNLMPPCCPVQLDLEGMRSRSEKIPFGAGCAIAFAPEDQVLYLAIHASKHQFRVPLRCFMDLAALLRASNRINWDSILQSADRIGATTDLAAFLCVSEHLGVAELPPCIRERVEGEASLDTAALAHYVIEWPLFEMPESVVSAMIHKSAFDLKHGIKAILRPGKVAAKIGSAFLHQRDLRTAASVNKLFGNRETV